jgi:hypothetical protein
MPPENYTLPIEETIDLVRQFPTPEYLLRRFFPEQTVAGTTAKWTLYPNTRSRADYTAFGAPARRVARKPMSHMAAHMAHIREGVYIGAASKYNRRPGSNASNEKWSVEDQVGDELADLVRRVEYRKEYERAAVLIYGIISVTYDDGSSVEVDYLQSTASHQLSVISNWSSSDADIVGDITSMKASVRRDSGANPLYLVGYEGLLADMIRNTQLETYWARDPYGMRALERGENPRLQGLEIIEYDGGYDASGTWTPYIPDGLVTCFADPGQIGLIMMQGEADDLEAIGNPGRFSKTWKDEDPSGIHVIVDDVSLAGLEVPRGITVTNVKAV